MIRDWIAAKARTAIDPERVRIALETLLARWPSHLPPLQELVDRFPAGSDALLHLFSMSPGSVEKIASDPESLVWLADPEVCLTARGVRRMAADYAREQGEATSFTPDFAVLRRCKGRETLRIALRDLAGLAPLEQTTAELTCLAEVCVREVYSAWHAELARRWGEPRTDFAVLGMGKFGGQELNYSSDIDVIFFYGEDGALDSGFSYDGFFAALSEKICTTFASTAGGPLFRIDLRLRPEGDSGQIVRSFVAMENYYAGFGETWERMALIKARGVAGSEELAYELCQHLQPFVYPRTLSLEVIEEIAAIKRRIEVEIVGHENLTRNVKLGRGGIREIEFVVQTLQLIHGARHPFLQERSTLKVLNALTQVGLIPSADATTLARAYRFLRTVEHRLQIEREAQTHTLPSRPEELARLGRSLGLDDFEAELQRQTAAVREIFEKTLESGKATAAPPQRALDGFADPEHAVKLLEQLRSGSGTAHVSPRTRRVFAQLEPLLLDALGVAADPDTVLARLVGFVERYGIRGLLFESLVTNPKLLDLLVRLFDASRFLTDIVLRRPQLIEEIARGGLLNALLGVEDFLRGLARNDEKLPWMDWVRVYRRAEILRIALRDVLGIASLEEVQAEYSALADACVRFVLETLGVADRLTVIAMGKFGGTELSYGCDLDVVFTGDDPAPATQLLKAMTATTAEGIVFPVDARLRPEGEAGLLVLPLASYADYLERRAQFWEAQALTKARPVAGPDCTAFDRLAERVWRRFGAQPNALEQIRAMHARVVRQRGGGQDALAFKTGVGGLMEAEFLVQGLQMTRGIREQNTVRAMEKLGLPLREPYLFLRRVEAVLRRVENSGVSALPADRTERSRLARRLGFAGEEELLVRCAAARGQIHQAFLEAMGG